MGINEKISEILNNYGKSLSEDEKKNLLFWLWSAFLDYKYDSNYKSDMKYSLEEIHKIISQNKEKVI
jgi:hypothetical protein